MTACHHDHDSKKTGMGNYENPIVINGGATTDPTKMASNCPKSIVLCAISSSISSLSEFIHENNGYHLDTHSNALCH
jgi:hypothetical protein